jgi:hypothetical protein
MKQIFKSIAAFALVASLSTSCSKDDPAKVLDTVIGAPTVTIISPTSELNLRYNSVVSINYSATPATGAKLKSITISRKKSNSDISNQIFGDSSISLADSAKITRMFNDTVLNSVGDINDKINYTITITDNNGKSTMKTVVLNIKDLYWSRQFQVGASASKTTEDRFIGLDGSLVKTVKLFKAGIATVNPLPSTADSATRGRFNSSKIDFLFFYGSANGAALYSPDYVFGAGQGWATELSFWTTKNKTIFLEASTAINISEFSADNFQVEQKIDALVFTGVTKNFIANMQSGFAYGFKTASGAKGFIAAVSLATDNTGFSTFEVKWKN